MGNRLLPLTPFAPLAGGREPVVRAGAERARERLRLRYVLGGPVGDVRMPAQHANAIRADRLWEHTCFEAFLAPAGSHAYWEVNLSSSGDWNTYRFGRYREGMQSESRASAPIVTLERASCGTTTLHAELDLASLPELTSASLDVGLAAVLEAHDGTLSYWALEHGDAALPDFHRRQSFALRLAAS